MSDRWHNASAFVSAAPCSLMHKAETSGLLLGGGSRVISLGGGFVLMFSLMSKSEMRR